MLEGRNLIKRAGLYGESKVSRLIAAVLIEMYIIVSTEVEGWKNLNN